jgi:non-canonical (house-cleaning) NTP pyrophosphatase
MNRVGYVSIKRPNKLIKIAVTSTKDLKINAVKEAFKNKNINIKGFKTEAPMAEQPIDTANFNVGCLGAVLRITNLLEKLDISKFDYIISMENSINKDTLSETANSVLYNIEEQRFSGFSNSIKIKSSKQSEFKQFLKVSKDESVKKKYKYLQYGYETTIGKLIHKKYSDIPDTDWIKHYSSSEINRSKQLIDSLKPLNQYLK